MIVIEPSLLSADFARLGEQACEAQDAGVEALQLDVMDGNFVPDITFGPGLVRALRFQLTIKLDVHLMTLEPERHLATFADAGADRLIVHQEACPHLHATLQLIQELGVEAGVALNPGTPISAIEEVLDLVDVVQVMTVNPGAGGQPFIASQLDKIRRLRMMLDERGLEAPIAVDGGIDSETAPQVVEAGAKILVAGSSIYNRRASVADNIASLRASLALASKEKH